MRLFNANHDLLKQQLRVRLWLAEAQSNNNNAKAGAYVFDSDFDVNKKISRIIATIMYSINSLVDTGANGSGNLRRLNHLLHRHPMCSFR